jgi:sterol desaturase/sphingolipid hydroxylase (fatty acid hydroxylase superfamily)
VKAGSSSELAQVFPSRRLAVESTSYEALIRLSAFIACFTLLMFAERLAPRRRRGIALRARWGGNLGLVAVDTIVLRTVLPITAVGVAALVHARDWGFLGAIVSLPAWLDVVVSVVVLDLAIYFQHRLFHAVPALWRLHRVHHTDPELDVTTGLRFHPVEMLLSVGFKAGVVIVLGPPVGAVVLFEVLLNAGSLFSHANLRLPATVDGLLRAVLITPDMHRVHHSADPTETNTNFGFTLSWWDRLLGTYRGQPKSGHDALVIGVEGFAASSVLSLYRLLIQPLLKEPAFQRAVGGERTR